MRVNLTWSRWIGSIWAALGLLSELCITTHISRCDCSATLQDIRGQEEPECEMELEPQSASLELDNDDGDYDNDDFEDNDALASTAKQQSPVATRDGQVHPLQPTDAPSKLSVTTAVVSDASTSAENEDDDDDTYSDDNAEDEQEEIGSSKLSLALPLALKQEQLLDVEHASSSVDHEDDSHTAPPAQHLESVVVDLVSIHAHRRDDGPTSPPPVPVQALNLQQLEHERTMQRLRLSAQRASVAAKRVVEYREVQARREAHEQAEAAALKKKREQFRASNRKHYDVMGVCRLTGEQRFAELVEETALLKQHRKACAELERRQRWYNQRAVVRASDTTAAQRCFAPAHVAHLETRDREERQHRHDNTVGRAQRIRTQQAELHRRAVALVNKSTCVEYVRGSFLLTHERKTNKTQIGTRPTTEHASTSELVGSRSTSVELGCQKVSEA